MMKKNDSKLTLSVHAGSKGDTLFGGIVNPIYPSSAYDYDDVVRYPRYYNTPNQQAVVEKMVALEKGEDGIVFSSGMAAIMTSIFALVKSGDHIILQNDLYGGTHYAAINELEKYGISYSMVDASNSANFKQAIRKKTRIIFIETPSNPLLKITNIDEVAGIARKNGITTIIDNTFASPINQNPIELGIDVVTHSATKYIGGHSDLCAGIMVASKKLTAKIKTSAMHFGGSLDAQNCYLLERSLKTIALRVRQQNENALAIANFLDQEKKIKSVNYPGLKTHPLHAVAKRQMTGGFGGMLSFEVKSKPQEFIKKLKLIKKAVSLGGVESTINQPVKTSHAKLTPQERQKLGISENLLCLSVGIEDAQDLITDIKSALK